MTELLKDKSSLRKLVQDYKRAGETIALVPTMGALHAGHLSLVELAKNHADHVIVSIFVNPTQFGENEDFDAYPRLLEADAKLLEPYEVAAIYAPNADQIYPQGFATTVSVDKTLTSHLCGMARPTHFAGVTTIVAKLLLSSSADVAVFGEKDFQQLQIIRRMVADLDIETKILAAPILRESDGLAMSSRNRYLTTQSRAIASQLSEILFETATQLGQAKLGASPQLLLDKAKKQLLKSGFDHVDYVSLVTANGLESITEITKVKARLLAAGHLGKTRLIDNVAVEFGA